MWVRCSTMDSTQEKKESQWTQRNLMRSTEVLVLMQTCRGREVVIDIMIGGVGGDGQQFRVTAGFLVRRSEAEMMTSLEEGTWDVWVLCGWSPWMPNSPRGKGGLEPDTKSPATELQGLARIRACTFSTTCLQ